MEKKVGQMKPPNEQLSTLIIKYHLPIVVFSFFLIRLRKFKTQFFQSLILLGTQFSILVQCVKNVPFMDMRSNFIKMQSPVQYMNMRTISLIKFLKVFYANLSKHIGGHCSVNVSKL